MAAVLDWLVVLAAFTLLTVACVGAARRLARPRSDDHAASRRAERQAQARREAHKARGQDPFGF